MDEALIDRIDEVAGERGRSQFVRDAVVSALRMQERQGSIHAARGSIGSSGHEWDSDPASWVRRQRRGDPSRVG